MAQPFTDAPRKPAYELVGHEGVFRLPGGRSTYSDVMIKDGGSAIRLARLEPRVTPDGHHYLHQINRYIEWEQLVEVIVDHTENYNRGGIGADYDDRI